MHATFVADIRRTYRNYRQLAERAIAQVSDEQLTTALDADDNSIAVIMRHVAGNLQSRFREFLTSDGEKPDRNRAGEFESPALDRAALLAEWIVFRAKHLAGAGWTSLSIPKGRSAEFGTGTFKRDITPGKS